MKMAAIHLAPAASLALVLQACAGPQQARVVAPPPTTAEGPTSRPGAPGADSAASSASRLARARAEQRAGRFAEAEGEYRAVLDAEPDQLEASVGLGRVYQEQGEIPKAIAVYQRALEKHPWDRLLLGNLAVCQRLAREPKKAEETLARLLSRSPGDLEALDELAQIHLEQNRPRLAEFIATNAIRQAAKAGSAAAGIHNTLGMAYARMDDRSAALAQFRKAAELDPAFAPAHLNIGGLALQHRDYAAAARAFGRAAELRPWAWEPHLFHAWALEGQQRWREMLVEAGRVLELRRDQPDAVYAGCTAREGLKQLKEAKACYEGYLRMAGGPMARADAAKQKIQLLEMKLSRPSAETEPKKRTTPKNSGGEQILDKVSDQ
jgi:tetratricopeptide (TPR) repeat protein